MFKTKRFCVQDFLLSMRLAGLPLGLLEAQGQDWRSVRRSCTPAFTGKKMKDVSMYVCMCMQC